MHLCSYHLTLIIEAQKCSEVEGPVAGLGVMAGVGWQFA